MSILMNKELEGRYIAYSHISVFKFLDVMIIFCVSYQTFKIYYEQKFVLAFSIYRISVLECK